eukprot:1155760-Pelagomonas_calceolata.AAC.3
MYAFCPPSLSWNVCIPEGHHSQRDARLPREWVLCSADAQRAPVHQDELAAQDQLGSGAAVKL